MQLLRKGVSNIQPVGQIQPTELLNLAHRAGELCLCHCCCFQSPPCSSLAVCDLSVQPVEGCAGLGSCKLHPCCQLLTSCCFCFSLLTPTPLPPSCSGYRNFLLCFWERESPTLDYRFNLHHKKEE